MVRVLEEAPAWSHTATCTGCKAKLEFVAADVKYGYSGLDAEGGYYSECPICGTQQHWREHNIPAHVRKGVKIER